MTAASPRPIATAPDHNDDVLVALADTITGWGRIVARQEPVTVPASVVTAAYMEIEALRGQRNDMLALLKELIDIEGPQPGTSDWAKKVDASIAKAEGR